MNRFARIHHRSRRAAALLAVAFAALSGCSSSTYGGERGGSGRGSADLLTSEEILQRPDTDAFTIIQQLRPGWLRARPTSSFDPAANNDPYVFVDDSRYGPLNSLYQLRSANIEQIEFISATDATTRFGTGFPGGIIRVIIKR